MSHDPTGPIPPDPDPKHDPEREFEDHRRDSQRDMDDASETLERVRREMPYRKALWGFRLYYIGFLSSLGSLIVGCFDEFGPTMVVVPIALPLGAIGYLYGYILNRAELGAFLAAATPKVWHARRDRKNQWQMAILRDVFMGRLQ